MKCEGVTVSGYWSGFPCGNDAKFTTEDGRCYCHAHYAIGVHNPERFEKAKRNREKLFLKRGIILDGKAE